MTIWRVPPTIYKPWFINPELALTNTAMNLTVIEWYLHRTTWYYMSYHEQFETLWNFQPNLNQLRPTPFTRLYSSCPVRQVAVRVHFRLVQLDARRLSCRREGGWLTRWRWSLAQKNSNQLNIYQYLSIASKIIACCSVYSIFVNILNIELRENHIKPIDWHTIVQCYPILLDHIDIIIYIYISIYSRD